VLPSPARRDLLPSPPRRGVLPSPPQRRLPDLRRLRRLCVHLGGRVRHAVHPGRRRASRSARHARPGWSCVAVQCAHRAPGGGREALCGSAASSAVCAPESGRGLSTPGASLAAGRTGASRGATGRRAKSGDKAAETGFRSNVGVALQAAALLRNQARAGRATYGLATTDQQLSPAHRRGGLTGLAWPRISIPKPRGRHPCDPAAWLLRRAPRTRSRRPGRRLGTPLAPLSPNGQDPGWLDLPLAIGRDRT
jgi:hypothetical protein